ncbi:MAG: hypothetical protein PF692_03310 [Kiritimatiellae bacterium]|jgi:MFS family permease|nr:hypothetical protein [Kiritimatiellia bacterium]
MRISSVLTGIGYLAVCFGVAYFVPEFKMMYRDFAVALPILTCHVINMGPVVWGLIGLFFAVLVVGKDFVEPCKKVPNWPFVVILLAITIIAVVGLFLPMCVIVDTV